MFRSLRSGLRTGHVDFRRTQRTQQEDAKDLTVSRRYRCSLLEEKGLTTTTVAHQSRLVSNAFTFLVRAPTTLVRTDACGCMASPVNSLLVCSCGALICIASICAAYMQACCQL
jgi:hypothetical protein